MKKKIILKVSLILIIGIILLVKSINVYATDLNNFFDDAESWENQGSADDLTGDKKEEAKPNANTNTNTNTNANANANTNTNTNANANANKNELPKAGLVEDSIMVIGIVVLGITAMYAYRKVNEYKGI